MSMRYASGVPHLTNSRKSSASTDMHRIKWEDFRVIRLVAECGSFRGGMAIAGVSLTDRGEELAAAALEIRNVILNTLR
jgi:hypothetical protein